MASATIATKYGTVPRNTWDGTEKIPLDVGGADGVGLASTLKTYIVGAGSVSVASGKTLTASVTMTLQGGDAAVLSIAAAKTVTFSNTLTFTGTDSSSVAFGAGGTVLYDAGALGTPASGTLTNATGLPAAGVVGTAAILGANTFTSTQTIVPATEVSALVLTGGTLAGATSRPLIDGTQTWNASGTTFTALKVNVTSTAAAAASLLLDLQLAGTSQFNVRKDGQVTVASKIVGLSFIDVQPSDGTVFRFNTNGLRPQTANVPLGNDGNERWGTIWVGATTLINAAPANTFTGDLFVTRRAAANWQYGAPDAASPVAQIVSFQGSRAGTDSNVGGADATINPSIGTGTGTPAKLILNGIVGFTTGSTAHTLSAALTIAGAVSGQVPSVVVGSAALATTATDGFIYIPGGAGAPTGVPTAFTGRYPLYWNTTNKKLYVYDAAWLGGTAPGVWS